MEFLMFNDGVELNLSGNGKVKIFSKQGMTDDYTLPGTPKNRAALITVVGCGDYWRIQPNFF
jgi:hypothetical protein